MARFVSAIVSGCDFQVLLPLPIAMTGKCKATSRNTSSNNKVLRKNVTLDVKMDIICRHEDGEGPSAISQ